MTTKSTCYSADDEHFRHDSLVGLIDEMRSESDSDDQLVGMTYYEAEFVPADPADYLNANRMLQEADERAGDDIGENYDGEFEGVSSDAKTELNALLAAWTAKHVKLSRYWIITGRTVTKQLTRDDIGLPAAVPSPT